MGRKTSLAVAAALGAGVLCASEANAALTLRLATSAGGGPVFFVDGGAGDLSPGANNELIVSAPIAGYSVDINVAYANDPGDPLGATLQVTHIAQRSVAGPAGPVTLFVDASETGFFTPGPGPLFLSSSGGGTFTNHAGPTIIGFNSYADPGNALFGTTVAAPAQGFAAPGVGSPEGYTFPDTGTPFASGIPYSITNFTTVTLSSPGAISNFSGSTVVVPEPATLGLLGVAGLALVRRRR